MKFLERIKSVFRKPEPKNDNAMTWGDLNRYFDRPAGYFAGGSDDLGDATYFTCLKTLSESIGKIPCYVQDGNYNRVYDTELAWLLGCSPNKRQTAAEFFSTLEFNRNHYGNGYAYINWLENGTLEGIYPLDARYVRVLVNNSNEETKSHYYYEYNKSGKVFRFAPEDILHVKSWLLSSDGYVGLSVRDILRTYMEGNKAAQNFQNRLFTSGLQANLAVKYSSDLNREEKKQVIEDLKNIDLGYSDRVMLLPPGWDCETLDVKLTDSDFFNLRKYGSLQVASAFGIKPNFLNDYSKSSYANSAAQNTSFYADTLLYVITLYEQEMSRKLLTHAEIRKGLSIKFNYSVILRADPSQQAEMLAKYVGGSIYTINEARGKAGLPPVEDGNKIIMASGYSTLDKVMEANNNEGN